MNTFTVKLYHTSIFLLKYQVIFRGCAAVSASWKPSCTFGYEVSVSCELRSRRHACTRQSERAAGENKLFALDSRSPYRVQAENLAFTRKRVQVFSNAPATCSVAGTSHDRLCGHGSTLPLEFAQSHPTEKFVSKSIKKELVLPAGGKK